ncbi:hypothetical protein LCGC14_2844420 [marine sediment metagenome]|uniref:Uncharacterized protein n=1 Tax=marine sediment metagenome TaxID=412755 RepID=A0A0F8YAF1_9ZZZZ
MGTITLPSYGTQLDIGFNNELRNVVVVDREGSPFTSVYVLWDDLNTPDQQKLIEIIAQYGSPPIGFLDEAGSPEVIPTPVAGWHTVRFNNLTFGGGSPFFSVGSPLWTGLADDTSEYSVTLVFSGSGSPDVDTTATASIIGSTAQTFPALASQLTAAFTGITVTFLPNEVTDGNLRFQTDSTGVGANVIIQPHGTLFNPASPLLGFDGFFVHRARVASRIDIFNLNRNDANVVFKDAFVLARRGQKPIKSTTNINQAYFDGTIWRRLIDDTPVT